MIVSWAFAVAVCVNASRADDLPQPVEPSPEHEWLEQLAGVWESTGEATIPGQAPITCTGSEDAHMLGDLWLVSEGEGEMMGTTVNTQLTLGYDPEQQKFVGTWIDSSSGYMWKYEGTLNEETQTLTLDTRGPCPLRGGEHANFRETIQIVDDGQKVFTSSVQNEDGSWETLVTVTSTRKQ
jgi:hypothetical protein